jgi:hypothetical protein
MWDVSLEVNFGENPAKPFKFNMDKWPVAEPVKKMIDLEN